jgi:hypothetical protein
MLPRAKVKKQEMEFVGQRPKNQSIVSRIRSLGYTSIMFNKDDYLDAVVWAANVVFEYRDFFSSCRPEAIVMPLDGLPFLKQDIVNAHLILMHYYNMKENFVLVEQFKQSLYTAARFQKIADGDVEMMKKVCERLSQNTSDENGFNFNAEPELRGAEKKYSQYSAMITAEIEKFREECAKAKL